MPKQTTWIVVADASGARLFETTSKDNNINEKGKYHFTGMNMASRDIASDRPGRTFDSGGQGRHAKELPTDPKRHEKLRLAKEVGKLLDMERKRNAFERLVLVAPPQFLGDLRDCMPDALRDLVVIEENKDLTKLAKHELDTRLRKILLNKT